MRCIAPLALGLVLSLPATGQTFVATLEQELYSPDGAYGDYFGWATAVSANYLLVGAPQFGNELGTGKVYSYIRNNNNWQLESILFGSHDIARSCFGSSISISGDTLVIGSPGSINNNNVAGSVYVYARNGAAWELEAWLTCPHGAHIHDLFGMAVAVENDTLVIGEPGEFQSRGAAYVFQRSQGGWSMEFELGAVDLQPNDEFGAAVALSANTVVVGMHAPWHYFGAGRDASYIFAREGGTWYQQAELTDANPQFSKFGASVALDGERTLIAAPVYSSVYIFEGYGVWQMTAGLSINTDPFGANTVALKRDLALVASGYNGVYPIVRAGSTWVQQPTMTFPDTPYFGASVSISPDGTLAVIGDVSEVDMPRRAYVYEVCAGPPSTILQPGNRTTCAGANATFSVVALGATGYQWRIGNTNLVDDGRINGATTPTLTINNLTQSDAGSDYNCLLTNACESAPSDFVKIALVPPGTRLYVNSAATGANDGTSWADAFTLLDDALASKGDNCGGEIWVAAGTYTPQLPGGRDSTFSLPNGVAVYGGFAGNETDLAQRDIAANPTILSGDIAANDTGPFSKYQDNAFHVVYIANATSDTILDGFTIQGGNCDSTSDPVDSLGGGLYIDTGTPQIRNCVFQYNAGTSGSAIGCGPYAAAGAAVPSIYNCTLSSNNSNSAAALYCRSAAGANIDGCRFEGNSASTAGAIFHEPGPGSLDIRNTVFTANFAAGQGGAILTTGCFVSLDSCQFVNNQAAASDGGAIDLVGGSMNARFCSFDTNLAASIGGAVCDLGDAQSNYYNCAFRGNFASFGGAFGAIGSSPVLVNSVFSGNSSGGCGGAIGIGANGSIAGTPRVINCSFHANSTSTDGSAICCSGSSLYLQNGILWNNPASQGHTIQNVGSTLFVDACDLQGGTAGVSDPASTTFSALVNTDPLYIDPFGSDQAAGTPDDNLRLSPGSPCSDAGHNVYVPTDGLDLDNDADTSETLPLDGAGLPRFVNNCLALDTGSGSPPVDLGAYEASSSGGPLIAPDSAHATPSSFCPGDSVDFLAVGGAGVAVEWHAGACDGPVVGYGNPFSTTGPAGDGAYYARWVDGCGNATACASAPFTMNESSASVGDLDGNRTVDLGDLAIVLSSYGQTGTNPSDLNNDSVVDLVDLSILLSHYGQSGFCAP